MGKVIMEMKKMEKVVGKKDAGEIEIFTDFQVWGA